jgi:hypothetical protein
MPIEREQLEADVLIIGAGPGGSCVLAAPGELDRAAHVVNLPLGFRQKMCMYWKERGISARISFR